MIKEFSVDFNKQTTFCSIQGKGSRLRSWVEYSQEDWQVKKIGLDTMCRIFEEDIIDYEQTIKNSDLLNLAY